MLVINYAFTFDSIQIVQFTPRRQVLLNLGGCAKKDEVNDLLFILVPGLVSNVSNRSYRHKYGSKPRQAGRSGQYNRNQPAVQ